MGYFYVYLYLDQNNIPFYVGKGTGKRWYPARHRRDANSFLYNKILKMGLKNVKVKFLYKNLTEEEAFEREEYWISYYGRRDLDRGPLCNLTDGGEIGTTGYKHTDETRRKMCIYRKGHSTSLETRIKIGNIRKGFIVSEETKQKIRETMLTPQSQLNMKLGWEKRRKQYGSNGRR